MSFYGNDGFGPHGRQISLGSKEAIDAANARPLERDRKFRDAGWWPTPGTALRFASVGFLVLVAIGWGLTLLNK